MKNQALEEATAALAQALVAVIQAVSQVEAAHTQPATRLYTYDDLAEILGKSPSTIRQWVCAGEFGEPVKVGSSTRVTQAGLDKYISDHTGPTKKRTYSNPPQTAYGKTNPSGQPLGI